MKGRRPGFEAPLFDLPAISNPDHTPLERPLLDREVLSFPAWLLTSLPLATTLLCSRAHEGGRLVLATHQKAPLPPAEYDKAPAFVGPELAALVAGAEQWRAGPAELAQWCARKADKPEWRLTRLEALGGLLTTTKAPPLGWTTERVLSWLGVELVEVRL